MRNIFLFVLLVGALSVVSAQSVFGQSKTDVSKTLSAYTLVSKSLSPDNVVPSVYEYTLPTEIDARSVEIFDMVEAEFVYSLVNEDITVIKEDATVSTSLTGLAPGLRDLDSKTTVDFKLPDDGDGSVEIFYTTDEPFLSNRFFLRLADNVTMPRTVAVYASNEAGEMETVLAPIRPRGSYVNFPSTESNKWRVDITYSQPLRLEEAALVLEDPEVVTTNTVRFLAQPQHRYLVYAEPDKFVSPSFSERADLSDDTDVVKSEQKIEFKDSLLHIPADEDKDGVPNAIDNCRTVSNAEQIDVDGNGKGDVCDDFDRDGLINSIDNCPDDPNRNQRDEDGDGAGDECDDEESRLTEKYAWIPWAGITLAAVMMIGMFMVIARRPVDTEKDIETTDSPDID